MRKTHFKIAKPDGSTEEVKIIGSFKHIGRLWIIHKINGFMYCVSDYLTGIAIGGTDQHYFKDSKQYAKYILTKNKDFDYSAFKVIN